MSKSYKSRSRKRSKHHSSGEYDRRPPWRSRRDHSLGSHNSDGRMDWNRRRCDSAVAHHRPVEEGCNRFGTTEFVTTDSSHTSQRMIGEYCPPDVGGEYYDRHDQRADNRSEFQEHDSYKHKYEAAGYAPTENLYEPHPYPEADNEPELYHRSEAIFTHDSLSSQHSGIPDYHRHLHHDQQQHIPPLMSFGSCNERPQSNPSVWPTHREAGDRHLRPLMSENVYASVWPTETKAAQASLPLFRNEAERYSDPVQLERPPSQESVHGYFRPPLGSEDDHRPVPLFSESNQNNMQQIQSLMAARDTSRDDHRYGYESTHTFPRRDDAYSLDNSNAPKPLMSLAANVHAHSVPRPLHRMRDIAPSQHNGDQEQLMSSNNLSFRHEYRNRPIPSSDNLPQPPVFARLESDISQNLYNENEGNTHGVLHRLGPEQGSLNTHHNDANPPGNDARINILSRLSPAPGTVTHSHFGPEADNAVIPPFIPEESSAVLSRLGPETNTAVHSRLGPKVGDPALSRFGPRADVAVSSWLDQRTEAENHLPLENHLQDLRVSLNQPSNSVAEAPFANLHTSLTSTASVMGSILPSIREQLSRLYNDSMPTLQESIRSPYQVSPSHMEEYPESRRGDDSHFNEFYESENALYLEREHHVERKYVTSFNDQEVMMSDYSNRSTVSTRGDRTDRIPTHHLTRSRHSTVGNSPKYGRSTSSPLTASISSRSNEKYTSQKTMKGNQQIIKKDKQHAKSKERRQEKKGSNSMPIATTASNIIDGTPKHKNQTKEVSSPRWKSTSSEKPSVKTEVSSPVQIETSCDPLTPLENAPHLLPLQRSSTVKKTITAADAHEFFSEQSDVSFSQPPQEKDNVFNLAKIVIGKGIAEHLASSCPKNPLLYRLYNACDVINSYLAKEKRDAPMFPEVLHMISLSFKEFFCGTLKTAHLPANSKILFTKELNFLRSICGRDILEWRRRILEFVLISDTIPDMLHKLIASNEEVSFDERDISPPPLVIVSDDVVPAATLLLTIPNEYVGYRPEGTTADISTTKKVFKEPLKNKTSDNKNIDSEQVDKSKEHKSPKSKSITKQTGNHKEIKLADTKQSEKAIHDKEHRNVSNDRHASLKQVGKASNNKERTKPCSTRCVDMKQTDGASYAHKRVTAAVVLKKVDQPGGRKASEEVHNDRPMVSSGENAKHVDANSKPVDKAGSSNENQKACNTNIINDKQKQVDKVSKRKDHKKAKLVDTKPMEKASSVNGHEKSHYTSHTADLKEITTADSKQKHLDKASVRNDHKKDCRAKVVDLKHAVEANKKHKTACSAELVDTKPVEKASSSNGHEKSATEHASHTKQVKTADSETQEGTSSTQRARQVSSISAENYNSKPPEENKAGHSKPSVNKEKISKANTMQLQSREAQVNDQESISDPSSMKLPSNLSNNEPLKITNSLNVKLLDDVQDSIENNYCIESKEIKAYYDDKAIKNESLQLAASDHIDSVEEISLCSDNIQKQKPTLVSITSSIPVCSPQKTVEGLNTMLEIVTTGIVASSIENTSSPSYEKLDQNTNIKAKTSQRRSISPGEIISSSPSPSPPPPEPRHDDKKSSYHHKQNRPFPGSRSKLTRNTRRSPPYRRRPSHRSRSPLRHFNINPREKQRRQQRKDETRQRPHGLSLHRKGTAPSESEDELELLNLRKNAIMSMIQESKGKNSSSSQDAPESTNGTSHNEPECEITVPTEDNFETVDMDISSDTETLVNKQTLDPVADTNASGSLQPEVTTNENITPLSEDTESPSLVRDTAAIETSALQSGKPAVLKSSRLTESVKEDQQNMSTEDKHTKSSQVISSSSSFIVKVLPGNEKTWKIDPVHITPHSDNETEDPEVRDVKLNLGTDPQKKEQEKRPVSGISRFLLEARKASLGQNCGVQSSTQIQPTTLPLLLPTPKKREYLQLKMKLEMHERKKQLKKGKKPSKVNKVHTSTDSVTLRRSSLSKPLSQKIIQTKEQKIKVARLNQALTIYRKQLQSYQKEREKKLSELTSFTEQLTECELGMEESDLKVSALETQLKNIQKQLEAARASQKETSDQRSLLQTKLREAKEGASATERKIKTLKAEIESTNTSLSSIFQTSPVSETKSLKTNKAEEVAMDYISPKTQCPIPEILIEPVSDNDVNGEPPHPASIIEVEPVSDTDIIEEVQQAALSTTVGKSYSLATEIVSDADIDSTTDIQVSEDVQVSQLDKKFSHKPDSGSPSDKNVEMSSETTTLENISVSSAVAIRSLSNLEFAEKLCNGPKSTKKLNVPSPLTIPSGKVADKSYPKTEIPELDCEESHSPRNKGMPNSHITILPVKTSTGTDIVNDSSMDQCSSIWCKVLSPPNGVQLNLASSNHQFTTTDKKIFNGAFDLFTLGYEDLPQITVPVDLASLVPLEVDPTCISQTMLIEIENKTKPSPIISTPLATHGAQTQPPRVPSTRSRKQKNPIKFTADHKKKLSANMLDVQCDSGAPKNMHCSTNENLPNVNAEIESQIRKQDEPEPSKKRKRSSSQPHSKCKKVAQPSNDEAVQDASDPITERVGTEAPIVNQVDVAIVEFHNLLNTALQGRSHLTVSQAQQMIDSSSHFSIPPVAHSKSTCAQDPVSSMYRFTHIWQNGSPITLPPSFRNSTNRMDTSNRGSTYTPYSSPLLTFNSYILNPAFRQHEKLQLSSLTYSNKLDPKQIICKFDVMGTCKDPKCTAQHIRGIKLSNKEIITNLASNAPQVAQCSPTELEMAESMQLNSRNVVLDKLSLYASNVIERYSSKLSDEEIYKLTAHEVNKARQLPEKHLKQNFVSFSERDWLYEVKSESQVLATSRLPTPMLNIEQNNPRNLQMITESSSETSKRRYFIAPSKEDVSCSEHRVGDWLDKAGEFVQQNDYKNAVKTLTKGLAEHSASIDLWLCLLRVHSYLHKAKVAPWCDISLDDLCTKALSATNSYTVVLQCIEIGTSYDSKQKWINKGLMFLSKSSKSVSTSHYCFELLMNSVLLDTSLEKLDHALGIMEMVLFGSSRKPCTLNVSQDILEQLTMEDKLSACLLLLHVVYWHKVPSCLLNSVTSLCVPSQVASKMFFIDWDKGRKLSSSEFETIRKYFKKSIELCLVDGIPSATTCLPLLMSMGGFEVTHGDPENAIKQVQELLDKTPDVAELWLLKTRILEQAHQSTKSVMKSAMAACPRDAWIYYTAAQMELTLEPQPTESEATRSLRKAVECLESCIKSFFNWEDSKIEVQPILLYRKLLGQVIPYDVITPPFIQHIDPKNLGSQLAPLWMCYCLLVELTEPSSISSEYCDQSAVDAFESAIHSVLDCKGSKALWRQYLLHLKSAAHKSADNFSAYVACTKRCLQAVDYKLINIHASSGQLKHYDDYSFHNEMIDMFMGSVQCTQPEKLSLLRTFGSLLPDNTQLMAKIVLCAMDQELPCIEQAQSLLALQLAKSPFNLLLWRLATAVETRMGRNREVRWMYQQATDALPHCLALWTDWLVFEVKTHLKYPDADPTLLLVTNVLVRAQEFGVELCS